MEEFHVIQNVPLQPVPVVSPEDSQQREYFFHTGLGSCSLSSSGNSLLISSQMGSQAFMSAFLILKMVPRELLIAVSPALPWTEITTPSTGLPQLGRSWVNVARTCSSAQQLHFLVVIDRISTLKAQSFQFLVGVRIHMGI
jgi:hypothetical protein